MPTWWQRGYHRISDDCVSSRSHDTYEAALDEAQLISLDPDVDDVWVRQVVDGLVDVPHYIKQFGMLMPGP